MDETTDDHASIIRGYRGGDAPISDVTMGDATMGPWTWEELLTIDKNAREKKQKLLEETKVITEDDKRRHLVELKQRQQDMDNELIRIVASFNKPMILGLIRSKWPLEQLMVPGQAENKLLCFDQSQFKLLGNALSISQLQFCAIHMAWQDEAWKAYLVAQRSGCVRSGLTSAAAYSNYNDDYRRDYDMLRIQVTVFKTGENIMAKYKRVMPSIPGLLTQFCAIPGLGVHVKVYFSHQGILYPAPDNEQNIITSCYVTILYNPETDLKKQTSLKTLTTVTSPYIDCGPIMDGVVQISVIPQTDPGIIPGYTIPSEAFQQLGYVNDFFMDVRGRDHFNYLNEPGPYPYYPNPWVEADAPQARAFHSTLETSASQPRVQNEQVESAIYTRRYGIGNRTVTVELDMYNVRARLDRYKAILQILLEVVRTMSEDLCKLIALDA